MEFRIQDQIFEEEKLKISPIYLQKHTQHCRRTRSFQIISDLQPNFRPHKIFKNDLLKRGGLLS